MPVIPPWPPVLARHSASSDMPASNDASKNVHKTSIIAGVVIGLLAFVFVARFVYNFGRPWYLNRKAANMARGQAAIDRRLRFKSCRPVPRNPSISTKPIELQEVVMGVQCPQASMRPGASFVPREVPPTRTNESYKTIDSVTSFGVAVPVALPASSSPIEVHGGRGEFIELASVNPFVIGDEENAAVYDGTFVGLGNSTY
jgi:hypothetical protein